MNHRTALLVPLLAVTSALGGCYATKAGAKRSRPVSAADSALPKDRDHVHLWVSPKPNRCPDATLPAPGQTPPEEEAKNAAAVHGLRPAFRACLTSFTARHPWSSGGSAKLALSVDCNGQVTRMRAVVNDIDRAMAACLMRAALATRFEPPSAGVALVNIPVTFDP
jgi:hypothetical protein